MKRKKVLVLIAALTMTMGMAACSRGVSAPATPVVEEQVEQSINGTVSDPESDPETVAESGMQEVGDLGAGNAHFTVNGYDIEVSHEAYTKYQTDIFTNQDFYCDSLDEPGAPLFIFIEPAGKSVYREVSDIQIDASQNVTITVRDVKAENMPKGSLPILKVTVSPMPTGTVNVVTEDGTILKGN